MTIRHDPDAQRFVLPHDGEAAFVSYRPRHDGVVIFDHVFVPASLRGTDTSRRLLQFAFAHAREAGWKVRPTCSYIAGRYVPRHPEVHDLIAD
ncbi:MAG: GNAT family N-acetyltransferase [Planctomycetota bacterium]